MFSCFRLLQKMSGETEVLIPCKYNDKGCKERTVQAELQVHEAKCWFQEAQCPFENCQCDKNTIVALAWHLFHAHKEVVLDSLSFELEADAKDTVRIYRHGNIFYLLTIKLQSKEGPVTVSKVWNGTSTVENCQIRLSTKAESVQWTGDARSPFNLSDLLSSLMLNVDVVIRGVNSCSLCDGLVEFRWARCTGGHVVCMDCVSPKHSFCNECEGDLTLFVDYNYKTYPMPFFSCFRKSCYFLTDNLSELKLHEAKCVFSEKIHRDIAMNDSWLKMTLLADGQEVEYRIKKLDCKYTICLRRIGRDVFVSATCENIIRPAFLLVRLQGHSQNKNDSDNSNPVCSRIIDPLPVAKENSLEKPQFCLIPDVHEEILIFNIIHLPNQ